MASTEDDDDDSESEDPKLDDLLALDLNLQPGIYLKRLYIYYISTLDMIKY